MPCSTDYTDTINGPFFTGYRRPLHCIYVSLLKHLCCYIKALINSLRTGYTDSLLSNIQALA